MYDTTVSDALYFICLSAKYVFLIWNQLFPVFVSLLVFHYSKCWSILFQNHLEVPRILWNPKVHYLIHQQPPRAPILSQRNPVRVSQTTFSRSISILSSYRRLGVPNGMIS